MRESRKSFPASERAFAGPTDPAPGRDRRTALPTCRRDDKVRRQWRLTTTNVAVSGPREVRCKMLFLRGLQVKAETCGDTGGETRSLRVARVS